jgi:hypothetical protein
MKKSVVFLFAGIFTLAAVQTSKADVIADWTFQTAASTNNIIGAGLSPSSTQSGVSADIGSGTASAFHATAATAWSIPSGNGSTNSWSANNWSVGDYFQFAVSTISYQDISISADQTGSNTGPGSYHLAYSLDGVNFTTSGLSYTIANDSWSPAAVKPQSTYSFDLSSVTSLNDASTVYFRLVDDSTVAISSANPVASGGTGRVDNFIVNGTLTSAPEPSSIALAAFGGVACLLAFRRRN